MSKLMEIKTKSRIDSLEEKLRCRDRQYIKPPLIVVDQDNIVCLGFQKTCPYINMDQFQVYKQQQFPICTYMTFLNNYSSKETGGK